jgi:hypothetical protein
MCPFLSRKSVHCKTILNFQVFILLKPMELRMALSMRSPGRGREKRQSKQRTPVGAAMLETPIHQ